MATYKGIQSSRATLATAPYGNNWSDYNKVTPSATLTTSDVVVLMEIPAGVRLETFRYYNEDFDTGTALVYDIGYRTKLPDGTQTDLDYISNDVTILRAATTAWQEPAFEAVQFNEPVQIVLIASVAPAGTSGTPSIICQASGTMVGIA